MMNAQQLEVYQRIQQFSLDEPGAVFPFSQRLARDNGWTAQYTQRVIDEYKKFLVLAAIAGHPITPSEQVDQVWHLHLTYTRSYWDQLCAETLQKPLHHHPTRGGVSEYEKFYKWYSETLISYEKLFNQAPPTDIWAPSAIRLRQGKDFVRINTKAYWFIPKLSLQFPQLKLALPMFPPTKPSRIAVFFLVTAISLCSIIFLTTSSVAHPSHLLDSQLAATQITAMTSDSQSHSAYQDWCVKTLVALSELFFLIGISQFIYYKILIKFPIFITPVGSSEFQSDYSIHDENVIVIHSLVSCSFIVSLMALTLTLLLFLPSHPVIFLFLILPIGILLFVYMCLNVYSMGKIVRGKPAGEFLRASGYTIRNEHFIQLIRNSGSIRPLRCKCCKQQLREVGGELSLENFGLTKPQIIAAKVNNIHFKVWHCARCYLEISRKTVHLYTLRSYQRHKTTYCSICKERTVRITYRTLTYPTVDREGEEIKIFTCECCGGKDEEAHTIAKITPPSSNSDVVCGACI